MGARRSGSFNGKPQASPSFNGWAPARSRGDACGLPLNEARKSGYVPPASPISEVWESKNAFKVSLVWKDAKTRVVIPVITTKTRLGCFLD